MTEEYKVTGSRASLLKLVALWMIWVVWRLAQSPVLDSIVGCSATKSECTEEQLKEYIWFQAFWDIPFVLFILFIGWYCLKIIVGKKIPPNGYNFPITINKVKYRDHYTLGALGLAFITFYMYVFLMGIYRAYVLSSI